MLKDTNQYRGENYNVWDKIYTFGISDRLDIEEEKISKLEYIVIKTIPHEAKRVSRLTKWIEHWWAGDNLKWTNIHVIGVSEEGRES